MEATAKTRFVRISAQKARLVADMIRGRKVGDALNVLDYTPKKAARIIAKTLRSAVANAEDQQNVDVDDLYVKRAFVDEGPTQRRILPRAQRDPLDAQLIQLARDVLHIDIGMRFAIRDSDRPDRHAGMTQQIGQCGGAILAAVIVEDNV